MIGYGRLNVALPSLPGFYWVWPSRSTDWKIKKNNNNQIDDDLLAVSMDLHGRHLIFSLNLSLSLSLCLTGPRLSEIYRVIAVCPDVSVTAVDQVVTAAKHFSFHTNLAGFTDSIYWFERAPKKLGQSQLFVLFFSRTKKKVHSSGHHQIQFADCRLDSGFRWANGSNPRPRFLLPWFISCPIGLVCGIKRSVCHGRWIL